MRVGLGERVKRQIYSGHPVLLSPSLSFNKLISPECPKFIKGHTLTKISENEFPDFEVGNIITSSA